TPSERSCDSPSYILHLSAVSGYAEPGRVLAIIGSSGAGKSTLLNMLTWRNKSKLCLTGDILANGVSMGPDISKISAYVQQDDLFMGQLTVKEHLMFAVSGIYSMISGGEMKRLSLASELLTNPSIMFFDEPTSGLDSYLAKMVVDSMKTVAKQGCTVICTIHQPSSEVFEIFDDLMILSMGRVVYHGEAAAAMQHYTDNGFPCPTNYNPADHYIMKISMVLGQEEESKQNIEKLTGSYENSIYKEEVERRFQEDEIRGESFFVSLVFKCTPPGTQRRYNTGYFTQLHACLVRAAKITIRNKSLKYKVIESLFMGILFGLTFLRTYGDPYSHTEVGDVNGCIFLRRHQINLFCLHLQSFPSELQVFRRDHTNRMYSSWIYFISKNITEFPVYLIYPLFMCTLVYFLAGFYPSAENFIYFYLTVALVVGTGVSFGYMLSCTTRNPQTALIVTPAILMPMFLFSGIFLRSGNVPDFLGWLRYLSWFYYGFEILTRNQWIGVDSIVCPQSNMTFNKVMCLTDGRSVMAAYDVNPNDMYTNLGGLFALLIGFRIIAFMALSYRVSDKK
uniref:ABC transporter domain-containing protein n=1 Tax=Ciona savignyi TaxID=51511 RepID=H2Z0C5_CIOSA